MTDGLAELLKFLGTFDRFRTKTRDLRQEVLELKSAQDSRIASTTLQSVRLIENIVTTGKTFCGTQHDISSSTSHHLGHARCATTLTTPPPLFTGLASPAGPAPPNASMEGPKDETRAAKRARSSSALNQKFQAERPG